MNENIDLCELLKGHEGEMFYSPICGNVKLVHIYKLEEYYFPIEVIITKTGQKANFTAEGRFYTNCGECALFPSKDQRDWNKWAEEQEINKAPKTWSEFAKAELFTSALSCINAFHKSNLAYLKICPLIEICYGGVPTKEERMLLLENSVFAPFYNYIEGRFVVKRVFENSGPIAFHTEEQCKEFLSHPENVQLLKDFYML